MILQSLKEYYDRKAADAESGTAPEGWIARTIDFAIVLDEQGHFVELISLQDEVAGRLVGRACTVPSIGKQALKHTNAGTDANLLWDNSTFVLGLGNKGRQKLMSFIDCIESWFPRGTDSLVDAATSFLRSGRDDPNVFAPVLGHPQHGAVVMTGRPTITFRLTGDTNLLVFDRPQVKAAIAANMSTPNRESCAVGTCLITGKTVPIERCHMSIVGVYGVKKRGPLVGFNRPAFCSYGKIQGANAPVGQSAALAYAKGLNMLLDKDLSQCFPVGDTTVLVWGAKADPLEQGIPSLFIDPPKDDPDRNTRAVKSLYSAVRSGVYTSDTGPTRFYVLGIAPSEARLAVRFWIVSTIVEMAGNIRHHFDDIKIVHAPQQRDVLPLQYLLAQMGARNEAKNIPAGLMGEVVQAILTGSSYPDAMLANLVRRVRADQSRKNRKTGKPEPNVPYARASLLKACLNRKVRHDPHSQEEELSVSLDLNNGNIGYRLGRVFATLEKLQKEANKGINTTIRDRYYGAASSTPLTVFGTLLRLKTHHLPKLESKGRQVTFEKLLAEIMGKVQDFPAYLSLPDQGRFAVGYYHQMEQFYTKSSETAGS